jgi:hypothetical protein
MKMDYEILDIYHLDIIVQSNNTTVINSFSCSDMVILNETISIETLKLCNQNIDTNSTVTIKIDNVYVDRFKITELKRFIFDKLRYDWFEQSIRKTLLQDDAQVNKAPTVKLPVKNIDEDVWASLSDSEQIALLSEYNVQIERKVKKRGRPRKLKTINKQ